MGTFYELIIFDALVKSRKSFFSVIPAKAVIRFIHRLTKHLDSVTLSRRKPGTGVTTFYETINSSI